MQLITLKAVRQYLPAKQVGKYNSGNVTMLFNPDGSLKATIPVSAKQPRKGSKFITLNCFKYSLIWD